MTYPPAGGPPDPYQPQQPNDPYSAPGSGAPSGGQPGQYEQYPPAGSPSSGQPYGQAPYGQAQYGQAPYGQTPYPAYEAQPRTNSLAIASLICSVAGLATCISAPVGIVLGHIAKRQIRETGEAGSGMATAGLWIGYILTIGFILTIAGIIVAAVLSAGASSTT